MRNPYENVAYGGMDVHYKFSHVTWRDVTGKVVMQERLDHRDRQRLRAQLASWPKGVPIVMEASFGWGWLSDEMQAAGLDVRLSNCFKVEHLRQARGDVKTNRKDADLLSLLPLVGRIERFRHHRALASYSLLAPRADETGEPRPSQAPIGRHLGSRGNRVLKWAFIEAAHGAVKKGGRWRAMWDRATDGGTKNKNRGYIKVARELVKMVYLVWSRGADYQEDPPPRPGRQTPGRGQRRDSRPGTGQPSAK